MKRIKTQQMPHLSVEHNSRSANKSISLWLLTVISISITIAAVGQTFAADNSNNPNNSFAGLYIGVLGSVYPEPFTLQLSRDGEVLSISEHEPRPGYEFTERESASLGEWRKTGPNSIELAMIQYRYGDFLCNGLESGRGDPSENCTLVIVIQATIDMDGGFDGSGVITILNRSSGGPSYEVPADIPIALQKTSIDGLIEMGSLP